MIDILAAIVSGAGIKFVDYIEDTLNGKSLWKWPVALIAGIALGYLLAYSPASTIFIAIIAGVVFMGKVDRPSLGFGLFVAVLFALLFGIAPIDLTLIVPFFILAAMDELPLTGALYPLRKYRLWTKIGALAVGLTLWQWQYFVALMAFDAAYILVAHYTEGGRTAEPEVVPMKGKAMAKKKAKPKGSKAALLEPKGRLKKKAGKKRKKKGKKRS